ncbi:hypothetical protein BD769DRAFT_1388978 [Suillus cothurnatus]|nr:hypothetical protein BD769DRAFT_1388978 [Suillus cothurnatus]
MGCFSHLALHPPPPPPPHLSPIGDIRWDCFQVQYASEKPDINVPSWMGNSYDVWFRDPQEVVHNMLANLMFTDEMDYRPYCEFSSSNDECQWKDFTLGDLAWDQVDDISKDLGMIGLTFISVILGSDKTTVSVGTGNNKYYPLYASIDAVAIIRFLTIPKTTCQYAADPRILQILKPGMTKPEVVCFGDSHFCCVIYGLGPYIADYEEQVFSTLK